MRRVWRGSLCALGAGCVALAALGWIGPSIVGALASPWVVQAFGMLAAVVLLLALMRAWALAVAFAIPLAALAAWVLPVLMPTRLPVASRTIRIVFANVNAWNAPAPEAVRWFESTDADVVALIECSAEWAGALRDASRAGGVAWVHEHVRIGDHPIGGAAIFSRHPLRGAQSLISPEGRFPLIDAVVEAPSGPLRIIVAHPMPPIGLDALEARNAEIRWLAQRCTDSDLPTAVVADFNDTPFGHALRDFRARSGLSPATDVSGLVTTWPSRMASLPLPAVMRIAIDHCFVSADVGVAAFSAGPDIGSDHLPLVIDLGHSSSR